MASKGRRRSGVTGFLADVGDELKDLVDDEVLDRARDTEHDLRRSGRRFTDDDGEQRSSRRGELDELRSAIAELSRKVNALTEATRRPAQTETEDPRAS